MRLSGRRFGVLLTVVGMAALAAGGGLADALLSATGPAGAAAAAAVAPGCSTEAPPTLSDFIPGHQPAPMTRLGCNADVAVYGDAATQALPAGRTDWVLPYLTSIWRYEKGAYGGCAVARSLPAPVGPACARFGDPKPLLVLLQVGEPNAAGSTALSRFDTVSSLRNTVAASSGDWVDSPLLRDVLSHSSCRLADSAGQGVSGSPGSAVWAGGSWAEFCQFDLYYHTGRRADAGRAFSRFLGDTVPAGTTDTRWFRDWFFPLWSAGGRGPAVADRFFDLLSRYFPTKAENGGRNLTFARPMTPAELVHFMSGAAGMDLGPRAAQAFTAKPDPAKLAAARAAFPQVKYPPAPCFTGATACPAVRVAPVAEQSTDVGAPVSLKLAATNPAGPGWLRYSAAGLPAGLSLNAGTGLVSGRPTARGTSYVTVTVIGKDANSGVIAFRWNVGDWHGALTDSAGRCVDDADGNTADGSPLRSWPCNGSAAQSFVGVTGQLIVLGNCALPSGPAAGSPVVVHSCDGSAAQRWQIGPDTVRNAASGLCLTGPAGTAPLTVATCDGSAEQRWKRE